MAHAGARRILVLAPHTDDGEFGCGGAIRRFCEEHSDVFYVAFSAAERSVPTDYPEDVLRHEVKEATATLGVPSGNLTVLSYLVREFPLHRQEILDDMIRIGREIKPDLVLLPSPNDTHQDHATIAAEGFRAFKTVSMLGYELPWNNLTFNTSAFVFLSEAQIAKKVEALRCYKSQQERHYANEEFIRGLARTRGTQAGCKYAEAFEVIRWIMK